MKFNQEKPSNQKVEKLGLIEGLKKKFGKDFLIAIMSTAAFSPLSAQKIEAQGKLKMPIQKEIKIDSLTKEEFEKQKEFFIHWFSFRNPSDEEFRKKFKEIQLKILENINKTVLKEDTTSIFGVAGIKGIAMQRNDTLFVDSKEMDEKRRHTGIVHELGHQAFSPKYNFETKKDSSEMPDWVIDLINDAVEKSSVARLKVKTIWKISDTAVINKTMRYFKDPQEIYARICVLREKYNFLPYQVVTRDDLESVFEENGGRNEMKNWNINELLGVITDPDILADLLNKLP